MEYKYTDKEDFSFLASGNVIKHFSGMPCFPVRLGLELFERAYHLIGKDKISVYDPCCGSGFSLTVLGMMKQGKIKTLYGSDIDDGCLEATECNLTMLTRDGLISAVDKVLKNENTSEERRIQLKQSTDKLLPHLTSPPHCKVFQHDILSCTPELSEPIDYVFADIPYGIMTEWRTDSSAPDPIQSLVGSIAPIMSDDGVFVICGGKDLRVRSEVFRRVDKVRVGKRLVFVLQKTI